jgi:hypothetical protein
MRGPLSTAVPCILLIRMRPLVQVQPGPLPATTSGNASWSSAEGDSAAVYRMTPHNWHNFLRCHGQASNVRLCSPLPPLSRATTRQAADCSDEAPGTARRRPAGRSGTVVAGAALGWMGRERLHRGRSSTGGLGRGLTAGRLPCWCVRWPAGAGSHGPWPPSRTAGHWVGAKECLADLRVLGYWRWVRAGMRLGLVKGPDRPLPFAPTGAGRQPVSLVVKVSRHVGAQ